MLDAGEESSVLTTILDRLPAARSRPCCCTPALGGLLGDAHISAGATLHALAGTVVYDVVLAPFVVPLVSGVARRFEPAGPR